MSGRPPDASVVICTHSFDRWDDLGAAVQSARSQVTDGTHEVIVVVDHNPLLRQRSQQELAGVRVMANAHDGRALGARNTGVEHTLGRVVAFLDDDAVAATGWLAAHLAAFDDPDVVGTGGVIAAAWDSAPPPWWPPEFDWVVGCTYEGWAGAERATAAAAIAIRNPIGANMAFRRALVLDAGGFAGGLGRTADCSRRLRGDRTGDPHRAVPSGGHDRRGAGCPGAAPGAGEPSHLRLLRAPLRRRGTIEGRGGPARRGQCRHHRRAQLRDEDAARSGRALLAARPAGARRRRARRSRVHHRRLRLGLRRALIGSRRGRPSRCRAAGTRGYAPVSTVPGRAPVDAPSSQVGMPAAIVARKPAGGRVKRHEPWGTSCTRVSWRSSISSRAKTARSPTLPGAITPRSREPEERRGAAGEQVDGLLDGELAGVADVVREEVHVLTRHRRTAAGARRCR